MKKPLILAISAVAVVTVLASPRLGFSANCTAPVISRPSNQAASYEPQFRYSPGDNLRLTDNLGETSFPEPAAPAAAEAAAVPEAPKNFRAVSYSGETTNLNWDAPETQPDRWLIRYRPIGGSWINAGTTSLNNYYTVTGLSASTSYDFIVYAENGSTAWSGTRSAGSSIATAMTLPTTPANLQAHDYTGTSVRVTWETATPHGADRWLIQCRKDGGAWTNRNISTYKGYVASSLDASATYEFRVYAERGATAWSGVRSAVSNTVSVTTLPAQPKNVKVESFTENSVYITWETASPHGADRWLIQCRKDGGAWTNRNISTYKGYVASSLDVNTTYEFRVYAERGSTAWSGIRSAVSNTVSVTTLPAQPTNLTVTDRQPFSISLSWSTPIPHGADRWLIQRRAIGGAWRNCGTSTNTSFVVTDLSPNTTYEIRVYSEAGLVAWSGTRSKASKSAIDSTLIYYGAKPYVQENSLLNCQEYAFFIANDSLDWMTWDDMHYLEEAEGKTLQQMLDYFRAHLEDSGKFLDIYFPGKWTASDSIFTLSSMRSNQWIVCMRAGRQFVYNSYKECSEWDFDYHFWYRTDTGRWAHKNGLNDSKLLDADDHPTNDSSPGWARNRKSPFYDSDIRYYRVSQ